MPLLEGGNSAVLLAGLGLDPELDVTERLGGAPATLDALGGARPRTLVIGADLDPAGAAAVLVAERGLQVRIAARITRSLPVRSRTALGSVRDYGDRRLLRERGLLAALAAAWVEKPAAVAGVDYPQAAALCADTPTPLPTVGAGSSLFALAAMAEQRRTGTLVAVEQASLSGITVADGITAVLRREPEARPLPESQTIPGAELPISLAAYERAFQAKVRWEAGRHADSDRSTSRRATSSGRTAVCAPTTLSCRCRAPGPSTPRSPWRSRCPV